MESAQQIAYQKNDKGPQVIGAQAACLAIACIGVICRFISRRLARAEIWIDDWLTVLALAFYVAASIDGFICISLGAGRHESTLQDPSAFAKSSFVFIVLYRPAIAVVKFSVLFLYRRVFPQAGFRNLLSWYGYFVLLYTTVFLLLDIFHCRPVSQAWQPDDKSSCLNMDTIWIIGGSLNAITDIGALCLPMPLLWRLHVGKDKRIQLMGVFLLGGFVCVVSIIRVIELGGLSSSDESYVYSTTIIWSTVEVGVGIFCACLPVMRPILTACASRIPSLDAKSSERSSTETYTKHSRVTNFRMAPYERGSTRIPDLDDDEPFAHEPQMEANATRHDSFSRGLDMETGLGSGAIAVTTKIEQEFNQRSQD